MGFWVYSDQWGFGSAACFSFAWNIVNCISDIFRPDRILQRVSTTRLFKIPTGEMSCIRIVQVKRHYYCCYEHSNTT